MKLTDVILEVREIEGWYYACLDHEPSGFFGKIEMPKYFLTFTEEQRNYYGRKIFSKLEKMLYRHAKATEKKPIPKPNRHAKRALEAKS